MKKILQALKGQTLNPPPIWLMRQAGRYLPEYRALREQAGSFLDLVYNPVQAAEITIQPLRRFGFDAAILFSDILVVPQGMGLPLIFTAGEGPLLTRIQTKDDLEKLTVTDSKFWPRIFETVTRVRILMDREGFSDRALIGFAGSPWTIACYMVAGRGGGGDFETVRVRAFSDPEFFDALIDKITTATIAYLTGQIRAGIEVIQLFDSWSGAASGTLFDRYVIAPTRKIVQVLAVEFPDIPIIGFPRGAGNRLAVYAKETGVQAVSCDYTVDLTVARYELGRDIPFQGNLDPVALLAGGARMADEVQRIQTALHGTPHIFNLGHGILPDTPLEHVTDLVKEVRAL